ncbi:P-loop containing nucleoside triphosphate hydrolase protein [Phlebopus sp. FC_14]|nr:P-loop containing nucleoside triphosphate hydrolase protein [Phlebopus sp. FC_14]
MPRRARVHFVSLRSSLVNLPISIYGPLLERSIRPQTLAVHLKSDSSNASTAEAYVGWTGMASASSLAHFNTTDGRDKGLETIEIDPQYAQGLGFAEGDVVEIGLLHDLSYASSVGTEPVTPDDWEIIESQASHVESTLLSQVRVAKVGQEIDVWVMGRTRVRLTVVSVEPPTKGQVALLTTDTEVRIAPKLHRRQKATPTTLDDATREQTSAIPPETVLRILPHRLVQGISSQSFSYNGSGTLAYIHPYTFSILAKSRYPRDDMSDVFLTVSYRLLKPPANPLESPKDEDSGPEPTNREPQVLRPGGKTENAGPDKPLENILLIGTSDKVMESHVYFPNGLEGALDWHWIHVITTGERKSRSELFSDTTTTQIDDTKPSEPASLGTVLSGVDEIIKAATVQLVATLAVHSLDRVVHGITGILLTGRHGVGKTSVAREIARRLEENSRTYTYTHYIDFKSYSRKPVSTLKALFRYLYEVAAWHRPTVLICDNLDKVLKAEVEHEDSFRWRHITELFLAQYSSGARMMPSNFRAIVMIGTAESQTSIHSLIHTLHIFQEIYHIKPPNRDARKEILSNLVQRRCIESPSIAVDPDHAPNFAMISTHTEGYSPIDLQDLVQRAVQQAASRAFAEHGRNAKRVTLSGADFTNAQTDYVPHALRDIPLQKSTVEWNDIGGLKQAKRILRETIEWPTKYAPLYKQVPLRLPSGLLLYGYPGCGKTFLASAVAKECGLNFISVKGPELLNKYIGASEKSVRDIFERATTAKPCVLFFDEFDSIAPRRGHDSTGVTDRVVNQLLTEMDGAEGLEGVYVLAATSRPDLIDSALLRPGRLDKSILCDMPDEDDRKDILNAVSRKVTLAPSVDLGEIAKRTHGFSGADLQALVYNAHLRVVHASIDARPKTSRASQLGDEKRIDYVVLGGEQKALSRAEESEIQKRLQRIRSSATETNAEIKAPTEPQKHEITREDLLEALKTTRPSVSREELDRLDRIYSSFVSDRTRNKKVLPGPSGVGTRATLG